MGDWDGVVLTHSSFGLLPVAKQTEVDYVEREVSELRGSLDRARAGGLSSHTVRQIERAVVVAEESLKKRLDRPRDTGLTFEQTGIDYLVVDELHEFKNLGVASNIADVASGGSKRAADLDMKVAWLRERAGERGRVMTGATATPIANSIAEAYVMQHYLRPDLLTDAGITDFDSWAATFGSLVTELELTPEGGYRQKTRFARFDNLPELLRMWHVSADVKTPDQLNLRIPALAARPDGERAPETVVVPRSAEMAAFMESLAARAEALRSGGAPRGKGEDNMLVVSSDGRKAALDLRMLDRSQVEPATVEAAKVDVVAARVHRIWREHREDVFRVDVGTPDEHEHPQRGGLQIVFADLGTPNPAHAWSFYDELRGQLQAKGMDPARVRFVQDANNDTAKARLFAACRNGEVDVIVGSTSTMGVGTNVQARAVALHHVDCPWRPADVEQREGRALRQGNQYDEIQLLRYVTEGSFDAFSWQTVERKQRFISQVMHGTLDSRGADDDLAGSQALSFSEVKALASGNPLVLERAQAEQQQTKLERLARAHERDQRHRAETVRSSHRAEDDLRARISRLEGLVDARVDTRGERFAATIGGRDTTERTRAAELLASEVDGALGRLGSVPPAVAVPAGAARVGGLDFELQAMRTLGQDYVLASLPGLEANPVRIDRVDIGGPGPITRLENRVAALDAALESTRGDLERLLSERAEAQAGLDQPFPRADELRAARVRLAQIDEQLTQPEPDQRQMTTPTAASTTGPVPDGHQAAGTLSGRERFRQERDALEQRREDRTRRPDRGGDPAGSPRRYDDDHPRHDPRPGGPRIG